MVDLTVLNPWWEHESAIEQDKHLRALQRSRYVHMPSILEEDFERGSLYIIRGPRQIGKTTFLKMLIRKKLKDVPKESIFYWSCDNLSTKEDLLALLNDYVEFCKIRRCEPGYIMLDEITGIEDWQKAIKFVIDGDLASEACFILTGSNSMDLKKGAERLPGRRGKHGKDLFLLPLTFREYVGLVDPDWYSEHKDEDASELRYQNKELKVHFERYMATGGIPLVINEHCENGEVPNYIYDLYYSWIVGDMLKEGKNEQTLKELMKALLLSYSTPVSWDSLAKRSSIKSHVTISSYIEVLTSIFVLVDCYFFDLSIKRVVYGKNKKIYFYDPFIARVFTDRLNVKVDKEKLVEGIVGAHIKYDDVLNEIYYTKIKKETDFVLGQENGLEVKYQNRISSEDFKNKRYFKGFRVLSKDIFQDDVVPVHVHLFAKDRGLK